MRSRPTAAAPGTIGVGWVDLVGFLYSCVLSKIIYRITNGRNNIVLIANIYNNAIVNDENLHESRTAAIFSRQLSFIHNWWFLFKF